MAVGVVGIGMVGSQLARYFQEVRGYHRKKNLFLFDTNPVKKCHDDVNKAQVVFLAVPTPRRTQDGVCDISAIDTALSMLTGEKIIVIKSTVPPGTTERYAKKYPQHTFFFNPEFLTESRAWEDMLHPDRQIVGHTAASPVHASMILSLLPEAFFSSPGTLGTYTFTRVNATEAEMGKYASNVFGAMKVTYANVLADMCEALARDLAGEKIDTPIDYEHVRSTLAHDRRIGDAWLNVQHNLYRGFGGACFPKDVSAFIAIATQALKRTPRKSPLYPQLAKGVAFLKAAWEYNETLLASQGLTSDDVSMHDREWLRQKLTKKHKKNKKA